MTGKANIRQSTLNVEPWKRGRRKSYERRQENGGWEWDIRQERKRIMMHETRRKEFKSLTSLLNILRTTIEAKQ